MPSRALSHVRKFCACCLFSPATKTYFSPVGQDLRRLSACTYSGGVSFGFHSGFEGQSFTRGGLAGKAQSLTRSTETVEVLLLGGGTRDLTRRVTEVFARWKQRVFLLVGVNEMP